MGHVKNPNISNKKEKGFSNETFSVAELGWT